MRVRSVAFSVARVRRSESRSNVEWRHPHVEKTAGGLVARRGGPRRRAAAASPSDVRRASRGASWIDRRVRIGATVPAAVAEPSFPTRTRRAGSVHPAGGQAPRWHRFSPRRMGAARVSPHRGDAPGSHAPRRRARDASAIPRRPTATPRSIPSARADPGRRSRPAPRRSSAGAELSPASRFCALP